jgi:multidrug efflux pump subunit AcrB
LVKNTVLISKLLRFRHPPVLSTIVAEIYGPNYEDQLKVADQVQKILQNTDDVVDVDWMAEAPQTEFKLVADKEKVC